MYRILFQNTNGHFILILRTLFVDFVTNFLRKRGSENLILPKKRKKCRFLAIFGKFAALCGAPGGDRNFYMTIKKFFSDHKIDKVYVKL